MSEFNVSQLMSADDIVEKTLNQQDWLGSLDDAYLFTLLNNLGMVGAEGNVKFGVNQTTGLPDDYTLAATLTAPAKTAAQIAAHGSSNPSSAMDLETILGISEFAIRVGMAFNLSQAAKYAVVRVESGTTNAWVIRTLSSSGAADATVAFTSGALAMLSDNAVYRAGAPEAQEFKPERLYNAMQMFDLAYGNEMVANSQDTKYDNSIILQGREQMKRLHKMMNRALIYNTDYKVPGTGTDNTGQMNGIAGWLGLADSSSFSTYDPTVQINSGTSVDFWNLREWADKFSMGNKNKLALTSAEFSTKIAQAASAAGETIRSQTIEFPRFNAFIRSIDLGNITLNLMVDRSMSKFTPYMNDGTLTATQKNVLIAIDRDSFKLQYHNNDQLGLLTPTVRNVAQTNDERMVKSHVLAGMSTALWKKPAHGAYALGS